jgi:hypothetical protein
MFVFCKVMALVYIQFEMSEIIMTFNVVIVPAARHRIKFISREEKKLLHYDNHCDISALNDEKHKYYKGFLKYIVFWQLTFFIS